MATGEVAVGRRGAISARMGAKRPRSPPVGDGGDLGISGGQSTAGVRTTSSEPLCGGVPESVYSATNTAVRPSAPP